MTGAADAPPPFAAYLGPFAAYVALTTVEAQLPAAWWPWAYAAKIAVAAAVLVRFRRSYPAWRARGVAAAFAFGVAMAPAWVWLAGIDVWQYAPKVLRAWLMPTRPGFDPATLADPLGRAAFLAVRLSGLALVVPLVEEIFWRGFLLRWFVAEPFDRVPEGTANAAGFAAATALFAALHPETLAAVAWALAAHFVWVRGRNLWASAAFHAGTNAALGGWILAVKAWHLW